jgi:hypothetical protein
MERVKGIEPSFRVREAKVRIISGGFDFSSVLVVILI